MSMPGGHWAVMRSMRRDPALSAKNLREGTARRVIGFARPYRWLLLLFLVMVIFDALIGVATPVLAGLVSNVVSLLLTAAVMFTLSWQITLLALILLPVFVLPARRIGTQLQEITRESYQLNASMNATMTERFNVAGALLVKLFGKA